MARLVALAALVLAVTVGALLWWWTLPPGAPATALAAVAARAPADADGLLVLATPARLLRWLLRHRQAALLLLVADPEAGRRGAALEPVALACVRTARGPVLVWWKADHLAIEVEADAGGQRALAQLAALKGLAVERHGDIVAIADSSEALGPPGDRRPPAAAGRHAALALAGSRWWWIDASHDRLESVTGAGASPPAIEGPSEATTSGAAPFLGVAAPRLEGRIAMLVAATHGWAVWLPDARPPALLRRLFGGEAQGALGGFEPHRVGGLPGELWIALDDGVALASSRELLDRVRTLGSGESGAVRGADLAWGLNRIAALGEAVPGLGRQARELRRTGDQLAGLTDVRWRVVAGGGTVIMEW